MRSIEASVQHLISSGFDPHLATDPYRCFVYTSFQERATKISHRRTAEHAKAHGAAALGAACSTIAVRFLVIQHGA
jgi:acyl-[acyl-carrier-protein] desaturase